MRKQFNKRRFGSWRLSLADAVAFWTTILLLSGSVASWGYEEIQGTPGVATNRSTVNFQRLAEWEQQFKTRVQLPPRPPRMAPFKNLYKADSTNDPPAESGQTANPQSLQSGSAQSGSSSTVNPAGIMAIAGPSPGPAASFPALEDNGLVSPPGTMGAVGPNHVMTTLNSQIRIQDRQGGVLSTVELNTFWATIGFPDVFSPKVVYDPYANRWILTALADAPFILGTNIFNTFSSSVLLAVSETDDPTGNWFRYRVFADEFGNNWGESLNIGFNKHWIVVSANMYTANFSSTFAGVHVYAFDKANVLTNGLGNHTLLRIPTSLFGLVRSYNPVPAVTYDPDLPEMYLMDVFEYGNNSVHSRLRISTISGDVGREILRLGTALTTNVVNWAASDFLFREGFAPQSGTFALIENNDARLQNVVYRNGSLWATHTIFLPAGNPNHSAVQWWQIVPPAANVTNITNAITHQFGRIEDTNAVNFYAFPSLAVNRCNDVMIGFSSFSSNQFASASYAFRFANDPTNSMRDPALLKGGEGPYQRMFGGLLIQNRWGDYSATVVDPANDLDMWTIQEYAETPSTIFTNDPGRWGTWWGKLDVASATQCGQIEFAVASYFVQEDEPTGRAIITVTNRTGVAGSVDFATSDGTAIAGVNYVATSGTLTFAAGQRSTNFTVTVIDDGQVNSNRTVNLTLFNISGAAGLGARTNAALVIVDDDGVPPPSIAGEFNFSSYFDTNGADFPLSWIAQLWGPGYYVTDWEQTAHFCGIRTSQAPERRPDGAIITITRSLPARGRVMVDFSTAEGGTAVPLQGNFGDYMATNMTLVFDDFQTSTQVLVRVRSNLTSDYHKYVRLVLSNPRPAPDEELENPGQIRPTLGPGASSQLVIVEISHGDPLLRFFGGVGGAFSTNFPAFSFERLNYRVDEYGDQATEQSGGFKRINVDIIKSPPFLPDGSEWSGRCIFKTQDPRIAGIQLASPFFQAGSDTAECLPDGGDPFGGTRVYGNPAFTDPSLSTITNYSDYEGQSLEISWAGDECRKTVTLLVTNDPTVEFNEDIICLLLGIRGEDYFPHLLADQCNVTILYHDQPAGALDREWNPDNVSRVAPNEEFPDTPGANETVYAVAVQPDGKTLLAGDFTAVNSVPRNRIARMEFNGDIDVTFQPGNGADRFVNAITLYPSNSVHFGKILIGGDFESFDGQSQRRIARLLPDGRLDTSFRPGNGSDGPILAVALQSDGKIIVAGNFSQFNNVPRNNIARLHPDGALDLTFNANPGPDSTVWSVALVPNAGASEKILIGGDFFSVNGLTHSRIAQLNPDGSLDGTFNVGSGANMSVYSVLAQPDGRLLVAGGFTTINDTLRPGIARLHASGILDESFVPGEGANDSVYSIALQPDGKVLIGGIFTSYNTTRRMALARLRLDGTLDTSFLDTAYNQFAGFTQPVSYLPPNNVNSIALQPDGNLMVGGSFLNVGGNPSARHALRNNYTVFTRADKRNRWNIARLIGGVTPGPGNADFDAPNYFVNETSDTAFIQLNRTDGRLGSLLALAVTGDRIASPTIDYLNATNTTAWREGMPRDDHPRPYTIGDVGPVFFRVPILDDALEEGDELIDLTFKRAEGSLNLSGEFIPIGAALGRSSAVLDVIDNDFPRGTFNFLVSSYVTNEFSTNAVITVIRTNGSVGSVSVEFLTRASTNTPSAAAGITCGAGVDYQTTRGRLQFVSGQTFNSFLVRLCNDDLVEFDENIELVLTNATGGARLPGGLGSSVTTSTLTIIDDDFAPGRINLASTTFTNNESEGFAAVRVTRSGGSVGTVSVQFRTLNGTATSPADYVATNGVLTWNDSDTAFKTIFIPLAQEGLVEGTENFRLELFNPIVNQAPDPRLLGIRTNALALIGDGDAYGVLAFNQPFFQADENGGSVTLTVLRSAGSAGTVSVNYSAGPDSAVPGVDFTPVSGTLTLVPGQFSATFAVPLADDSQSDGNKVVRVELTDPVNALLGVPSAVNLVLVDDESFNNPPGTLDTTFDSSAQANGPVYSIALYLTNGVADGRLMIAGDFTNVNNIVRQGIARLNANGSLDTTFNIGTGPNAPVRAMAIQADGKVLFGGFFSEVTGTNRNGIARVNVEGTLDTFFNPGSGADGPIYAIAVQADERILAAGAFSDFDNQRLPGIVRLLPNGRVDTTFNAGSGPDGVVFAFAIQPDGKILIGGDFRSVNGVQRPGIARLHRNGNVDMSFDAGTGTDFAVRAIVIQPDGKIVIGGAFMNVNGVPRNFLARLERHGALDTAFMNGLSGANLPVQALALHADGKIVVAGDFTRFHDVTRNHITRLNSDGTTDTTINFGTGANAFVAALAIQPDRRIVLGGAFTSYDNQPRSRIARIYGGSVAGPGSLEFLVQQFVVSELNTNALISVRRRGGTTGTVGVNFYTADDTALDGRDYVATNAPLTFPPGEVLRVVPVRVLLNPAPSDDLLVSLNLNNFTGGAAIGSRPTAVLVIRNEQALIGFSITNFVSTEGIPGGLATIQVSRGLATNTQATIDFSTAPGGNAQPGADYIPTNGTLLFLIGQVTKTFNVPIIDDGVIEGQESLNLVLSNPSVGAFLGISQATLSILDNDFAPGQLFFSTPNYLVDESGGFVELTILRTNGSRGVVSVDLVTRDGTATVGSDYAFAFRRLSLGEDETNGTFTVAILDDLVVEGNETVLVTMSNPSGGAIISGPTNATITIVENDFGPGNLLRDFDPGEGANNYVRALAVQRDGRIVVGGAFTAFDNTNRNYLARLNADGSQDLSFAIGTGANSLVSSLAMGLDQRIFVGGTFTAINGAAFSRVGRLLTNGAPDLNYNQVPGFNAVVHAIAVQTNGNLLVGGNFALPARSLSQLRVNGSIDSTFVVGTGADNLVHAVAAYQDGSVIAAGGFTNFNGVARSRIVRLNRDGTVDLNFTPALITNGIIYAVALQTNGQVLIAGDFQMGASAAHYSLARLNADGSLDSTFRGTNGINGIVFGVGVQSSGRIVVGGNFTAIDGVNRNRYARLNTNGSLDETFNPGIGANNTVYAVCILPDDNILLGGEFTLVNGILRRGVAKIRGNDREARFYSIAMIGSTAQVSFSSTPGVNYILQASSNLINWVSLSTNNASADTLTIVDPAANLHKKRFYKVRQAGQ